MMSKTSAWLERGLQTSSGNFDGQRVSDCLSRAPLILIPRRQWQSHPNRTTLNQKLDVHGIGMASRNRDNKHLINTMDLLFSPAIERVEVAIHAGKDISIWQRLEQSPGCPEPRPG